MTIRAEASRAPRCSLVAYTGALMNVEGFGMVCIDLQGLDIPADGFPLLADHANTIDSLVGNGRGTVSNGQLLVEGQLVTTGEAAGQIVELAKSGVQLSASVGVEPIKQRRVMPGESIFVNGRSITADEHGFTLVTKGRLREVSILPIGADSETSVSIAASYPGVSKMNTQTPEQIRAAAVLETGRVNTIQAAAATHRNTWGHANSRRYANEPGQHRSPRHRAKGGRPTRRNSN